MKYFLIFTNTLFLCFLTLGCLAQTQDGIKSDFYAKLKQYSSYNKTIESDFIQTKRLKKMTKDVVLSGRFYYDNNGSMALIYKEPFDNKIIIKDNKITVVTANKATTTDGSANPMLGQVIQMLKACMTGDISKLGVGWQELFSQNDNSFTVEMIPTDRQAKKFISKITLVFNKATMTLDKLYMEEASGNYSTYLFKNKQLNQSIDSSKFKS